MLRNMNLRYSILTSTQMQWADQATIKSGVFGFDLMYRAGSQAAEWVVQQVGKGGHVLIAAGPGNNGGDGFVIAHELREAGVHVELVFAGELSQLKGEAGEWAAKARDAKVSIRTPEHLSELLMRADLVVDALFGTGLGRELTGEYAEIVRAINASHSPVLAIDIASGIHSDTGEVLGSAVKARWTLPIAACKWGHFLGEGRAHVGEILPPADIGISADTLSEIPGGDRPRATTIPPSEILRVRRPLQYSGHKRSFGHTWIFGGSPGYAGAPQLAAGGAWAAGAGLVSIACPKSVWQVIASNVSDVMVHEDAHAPWQGADALLAGPGWGQGRVPVLEELLEADIPLILDADALNLVALSSDFKAKVKARKGLTVLTPHPGEAARLLGVSSADVQVDRLGAVLKLSALFGAWVVLKGSATLIAGPVVGEEVRVCSFGSSRLARAGTGDVLAGMIAALTGRGLAPEIALPAAVGWHALASESDNWYRVEQLPDEIWRWIAEHV